MKHFLSNQQPSKSLIATLRNLALMLGLFLFMGNLSHAQSPRPSTNCANNPVTLAKPYIGYDGLANETAAMYSWCRNDSLPNIQTYCLNLSNELEQVANYNTLSDACKAVFIRRKQELEVVRKLAEARH